MFQGNNSKANAIIDHFVRFVTMILRCINKVKNVGMALYIYIIIIMLGLNLFMDCPEIEIMMTKHIP